jgi:hypothetical protein
MSRPPPHNDRGYQPLQQGGGFPQRPGSGPGLFDRRSDRTPPQSTARGPPPGSYDQRSMERRPVAPQPQQAGNPGFLSKLTQRGNDSSRQFGGIFRVAKVCPIVLTELINFQAASQEASLLNVLYVSPADFPPNIGYVIVDDMCVFTVRYDWCHLSLMSDKSLLFQAGLSEQV